MATGHEVTEKALKAMKFRRQGWTILKIALYLDITESYAYKLLTRARKLWSLLADAGDSKTRIGENLAAFEEMERMALEKFAKANPNSTVAVAYLKAARDARKEIKRLYQEAGLMTKVPVEVNITNIPMEKAEARALTREYLKNINELSEKND